MVDEELMPGHNRKTGLSAGEEGQSSDSEMFSVRPYPDFPTGSSDIGESIIEDSANTGAHSSASAAPQVSAHPEATIADSRYSLADIERRRARPVRWVVFLIAVLAAIVIPYGYGRSLAINHTQEVLRYVSPLDPRGIAVIAWSVTLLAFVGIGMSVIESRSWFWRVVFVVGLAAEQMIAGLCLLKFNFWYGTFVVYHHQAILANAANLGIIAAGLGVAVFAVLFVAILVCVRKDSRWNSLTHSWSALTMFFLIELAAIAIVLFGGLINAV